MRTLLTSNNTRIILIFLIFSVAGISLSGQDVVADEVTFEVISQAFEDGDVIQQSTVDPKATYLAVDKGISAGASLDMSSTSQLHSFNIYGRAADNNNSSKIIEIGYKKRF